MGTPAASKESPGLSPTFQGCASTVVGPWASFGGCQEQWVCLADFVPCHPYRHQQLPNKFSEVGAGSVSIGSSGGSPGGGYLGGGTLAAEELAVV